MKQTFISILAMLFAFAMPVQASEVLGDFRPGYLVGPGSGDVIGPKVTDDSKVTTCRCMQPQLEAAAIISDIKPPLFAAIGASSSNAKVTNSVRTMHEVGWRGEIKVM